MTDFYGLFSVDASYLFTGMAVVMLLLLVLTIVSISKANKMQKKYESFMRGASGKNIESLIQENLSDISALKKGVVKNTTAVRDIYDKLEYTISKVGVVKYDAFHEMGGKLSFALCMLDRQDNGYVVNVMHSNNGCFAYVKEIVNGQAFIELGDEEQKAVNEAVAGKGDAALGPKVNEMINVANKNKALAGDAALAEAFKEVASTLEDEKESSFLEVDELVNADIEADEIDAILAADKKVP